MKILFIYNNIGTFVKFFILYFNIIGLMSLFFLHSYFCRLLSTFLDILKHQSLTYYLIKRKCIKLWKTQARPQGEIPPGPTGARSTFISQ